MASKYPKIAILAFAIPALITFLGGLLTFHRVVVQPDADAFNFYRYSHHVFAGERPYRDFMFEFPPLALLPMLAPDLLTWGHALSYRTYCIGFLAFNALTAGALGVTLARVAKELKSPTQDGYAATVSKWYTILLLSTVIVIPWRFDLFPTLLTALALLSVLRNRSVEAGVLLGIGTAVKLYPLLLVPVFALMIARKAAGADEAEGRQRGHAKWMVVAFTATVAVIFGLSAAIAGPSRSLMFLTYQGQRGIQIESVTAGFYFLAHALHLCSMGLTWNFGAFHMTAPGTSVVMTSLMVLLAALYCAVVARLALRGGGADATAKSLSAGLLVLLVFIATSKVFSPQYLAWLIPFAALLLANPRLGRPTVYAVLALFALTAAELTTYAALLTFDPLSIALLNLRSVILVWAAVLLYLGDGRLQRQEVL